MAVTPSDLNRVILAASFAHPSTRCGSTLTGGPNLLLSSDPSPGVNVCLPLARLDEIGRLALTEIRRDEGGLMSGPHSSPEQHRSGNSLEKVL